MHSLGETRSVTKKEIVKDISDATGLTQLKTKEVVQKTFDAIVDTLLENGRIAVHGPAEKLQNDPAVKAAYLGGG